MLNRSRLSTLDNEVAGALDLGPWVDPHVLRPVNEPGDLGPVIDPGG